MRKSKGFIVSVLIVIGFLLIMDSCKVGKDYRRQEVSSPESFRLDFPKDSSISNIPWWELFRDPVLVELIDSALVNNRDVQIAISRMQEAELQIEVAKADYYPFIGYNAYGSSLANSEASGLNNQVGTGLNVSYTADLWQRIRTQNKIALQNYLASEEAYKALNIIIVSAVASAYVALRDADNRRIIAEKTADNFQDNLEVMQARFECRLYQRSRSFTGQNTGK